ncbi:cellulase family glycosylhydrolase [Crocinitomix catalasitica]|nr:cellulase family glycosylhydrolase [Crocinitomix catalasitica]
MKTKNLFLIILILIVGIESSYGQLTKFQKWELGGFFKGYNISEWNEVEFRFINQSDLDNIKATGANYVQLMPKGPLEEVAPYGPKITYINWPDTIYWADQIDSMVTYAQNAELYYTIVIRSGPGRYSTEDPDSNSIFMNSTEQQLYAGMLRSIAEKYNSDTLFAGLDMMNEPNPLQYLYGSPIGTLNAALTSNGIDLQALYAMFIDSVRTVAPTLPLIVEGVHWSDPEYFSLLSPQADNKIVYNSHVYSPAWFSHSSFVPYDYFEITYPGNYYSLRKQTNEFFDYAFMRDSIFYPVNQFLAANGNPPMLIGEFGLQQPQNGGEQYLSDIANIACNNEWHFVLFDFKTGYEFNYQFMDDSVAANGSWGASNYWDTTVGLMNLTCGTSGITESSIPTLNVNVYPNPFTDIATIVFDNRENDKYRVDIYDSQGRLRRSIPEISSGKVEIERKNLSNGLYFFQLSTSKEIVASGKLLIE